jgi:hypothetical protein
MRWSRSSRPKAETFMQTHLTDDELVLHYYGEMAADDEARAMSHVQECRDCHGRFRTLQRVLSAVDENAVSGADLPAHFERTVWARLEPNLRRERPSIFSWLVLSPARLGWAAAVLLLVTAAFVAGRLSPAPRETGTQTAVSAAQVREGILLSDLGEHLDRSQMMLVELASANADEGFDRSRDRERAGQLVAASRLYRQTAAATGDSAVVDLLDDLERLLVDLAASPGELSADELASVRRRIDAEDLLFKIRVLSTAVRERQKTAFEVRESRRSAL